MQISVLYRTHPSANNKKRPPWSSRALALRSLRQSLERTGATSRLTFVADGGLPAELAAEVGSDEVVVIRGGNAASSLRRCIDVATSQARSDPPDTLYWFAEDDYLYRPGAFTSLITASQAIQEADYLALHVANGSAWHAIHKSQPDLEVPPLTGGDRDVDGVVWRRVRGTTSSFGTRRDSLLEDARLLKLGSMAGAPFDGATWHALQGAPPYAWRYLLHDLDPGRSARGVLKVAGKPVMRTVVNVATTALGRRRVLVGPHPDLAVHLETDLVPAGAGWEELAREIGRG